MLGAIISAAVKLSFGAAGHTAKIAGEAVELGSRDGSIPVFNALGQSMQALGDLAHAGGDSLSGTLRNLELGGVDFKGLGRSFMQPFTVAIGAPEVSSLGRNVQQANLTTQFCVAEANLGGFASPLVGCKPSPLDGPALFT